MSFFEWYGKLNTGIGFIISLIIGIICIISGFYYIIKRDTIIPSNEQKPNVKSNVYTGLVLIGVGILILIFNWIYSKWAYKNASFVGKMELFSDII